MTSTPRTPSTPSTSPSARPSAPLPATAVTALMRAHEALADAANATAPAPRYAAAHVAALRATAALLAVRTRPSSRRAQRNAWTLLAQVAPELEEWAVFFAAGAGKRAAAEAGLSRAVSTREADDLLRDSGRFLALVERMLGLPSRHDPSQLALPPARAS
jgi:SAV_6107-like HEPN